MKILNVLSFGGCIMPGTDNNSNMDDYSNVPDISENYKCFEIVWD